MSLNDISIEIKIDEQGVPNGIITFSDGRQLKYEGHGDRYGMTFPCNDNDLRDEMDDSSDEYDELHSAMFGYMMKMVP